MFTPSQLKFLDNLENYDVSVKVKNGKNFPSNVDYFIKVMIKGETPFKTQPQKAQNPHWSELGTISLKTITIEDFFKGDVDIHVCIRKEEQSVGKMSVKIRELKMTKEYFQKSTKIENKDIQLSVALNFQERQKDPKLTKNSSFSDKDGIKSSSGLFGFGKAPTKKTVDLRTILSKQKVKTEQETNISSQLEMINRLKSQLNENDSLDKNLGAKVPKRAKSVIVNEGNESPESIISSLSLNQVREHEDFIERVKDIKNNLTWKSSIDGSSLLHKAVVYERMDIVEDLIKEGIDPNGLNNTQSTPLIVAASIGNREISLFLIKSGSKISSRDIYGYTPLLIALKHHHFHLVSDLLLFGGDLNQKKENGMTILHEALLEGNDGLIDHLLTYNNLKLNIKDPNGKTPLLRGCEKAGLKTFVKFLKKEGVDTFCVDDFGRNFFHLLVKNERINIIEYFLQDLDLLTKHKKLLSDPDSKGKTPLHLAVEVSNFSVLKALIFILLHLKIEFYSLKDNDGLTPYGLAFKILNREIEDIMKADPTLDTEGAFKIVDSNAVQIQSFLKTYEK